MRVSNIRLIPGICVLCFFTSFCFGSDAASKFGRNHSAARGSLVNVKVAFKELIEKPKVNSRHVIDLIKIADERSKVWIRDELIKRFNSDPDSRVRNTYLNCLMVFPEAARKVLVQGLSDSDRDVRLWAANLLGDVGTEQEVDALIQVIREDKGEFGHGRDIARRAISSLGKIGGKKVDKILLEVWYDNKMPTECRNTAIRAIGRSGDPDIVEFLATVLEGEEKVVRSSCVFGLISIAQKNPESPEVVSKAINLIRKYIYDENPRVRLRCVQSLEIVGNSNDISLIEPMLNDPYTVTRTIRRNGIREKTAAYPIREEAGEAIKKIKTRLASQVKLEKEI